MKRVLLLIAIFCLPLSAPVVGQPHIGLAAGAAAFRPVASYSLQPGRYTWVLYSSHDLEAASDVQSIYARRGVNSHVMRGEEQGHVVYRVTYGAYETFDHALADRGAIAVSATDVWVMNVSDTMRVVNPVAVAVDEDEAREEDGDDQPRKPAFHELVEADVRFSNVFDSNIEHDDDENKIRSFGFVPGLHVRLTERVDDPLFSFDYTLARHAYSNSQRWDRVSNMFQLTFAPEFTDRFHGETSAEVSLKGSSEDRDLSNQYQVVQEFEYRITRDHRIMLYGTLRLKRFPESPEDNDFKPNTGLVFERRLDDGERIQFEARYERNIGREADDAYTRWTYTAEYRTPAFDWGGQFELQARYRSKLYDLRLVELDDIDYLRHDQQWSFQVEWSQRLARKVDFMLGYEYEFRNSNDPDRFFDANLLTTMLSYRL